MKLTERQRTTRELDALLKRAVHARDHNRCRALQANQCHDKTKGKGSGRGFAIQACHIYGKGAYPGLRYELRNVVTLCQPCHAWTHQFGFGREASTRTNVVRDWYADILGRQHLETLDAMVAMRRHTKRDPKLLKLYLEQAIREYGG